MARITEQYNNRTIARAAMQKSQILLAMIKLNSTSNRFPMTPIYERCALAISALLSTLLVGSIATVVRAQTPTQEQMQMFQGLTPEQQQMVLQQMSPTTAVSQSTTPGGGVSRGTSQSESLRQSAMENGRRFSTGLSDSMPLEFRFKAQDVLLIEIGLPGEINRAAYALDSLPASQFPQQRTATQAQQNQSGQSSAAPQSVQTAQDEDEQVKKLKEQKPEELKKLRRLVELIRSYNPYRLDRDGQLLLPGFSPIQLAGLNDEQATQRLSVDPAILSLPLKLDLRIIRLPLTKSGTESLKPFGYDLFDDTQSMFAPVTDLPVPADYIVGAGDELNVQLYGSQNRALRMVVSREGTVSFPELGPISVGGLTFSAAKNNIENRVSHQLIGVHANVSMGEIRAIRVFVLGEARRPGSYTVSGLATITTALFASGGVKPIGSLRDIQLKRQGAVVRHLDLYDLLIEGNTGDDAKLLPGDAIFIPVVGPTVSIEGEVKRPAIYELQRGTDVGEGVRLAGGLTPEADPSRTSLQRIDDRNRRVVVDVDLNRSADLRLQLRTADVIHISRLRPQLDSGVLLEGYVHRPGLRAWHEGVRISEMLPSVDELKPDADSHYILIRREVGQDRHVEVLSVDLTAALSAPGGDADISLQPRDRVMVFELAPGRERIIKPLLEELRVQSGLSRPTQVVEVSGQIKVPGEYPLETGMRISDLLRAGGNLESAAFGGKAELARYEVTPDGLRQTRVLSIDLVAVREGDAAANIQLQPFDHLLVRSATDWTGSEQVVIEGEVRFPGTYPIRKGETLREVLARAGGLTSAAYPRGAIFTREDVRKLEQDEIARLSDRLQGDLATMAVQGAAAAQVSSNAQNASSATIAAGQSLLSQLRQTRAVGRVVIDLSSIVADTPRGRADIQMRDGDKLIVPQLRQTVTVLGEVQSGTTSLLYQRSLSRDDYINRTGGLTRKADKRQIYVVRADGSVQGTGKNSLFTREQPTVIQPGDAIVVPVDSERIPSLPLWQSVTQILANMAVTFVALKQL